MRDNMSCVQELKWCCTRLAVSRLARHTLALDSCTVVWPLVVTSAQSECCLSPVLLSQAWPIPHIELIALTGKSISLSIALSVYQSVYRSVYLSLAQLLSSGLCERENLTKVLRPSSEPLSGPH